MLINRPLWSYVIESLVKSKYIKCTNVVQALVYCLLFVQNKRTKIPKLLHIKLILSFSNTTKFYDITNVILIGTV